MGTNLAYLKAPWQPGQSGNPAGRPKGARSKLEEVFLRDLLEHWNAHGVKAIDAAAEKDPVGYVKVVASLMPKVVDSDSALEDFSRDELRLAIDALRSFVALGKTRDVGSNDGEPGSDNGLQPVR